MVAADDGFDLHQLAFDRAGDALDQRHPGGRRRIGGLVDGRAPQPRQFLLRDFVVLVDYYIGLVDAQ